MAERFTCECHIECIVAVGDEEWEDEPTGSVELAFWKQGRWGPGLRQRFRHIWRIFKKGDPYEDFVVLSDSEARRFGAWLITRGKGELATNADTGNGATVMTWSSTTAQGA